MADIASLALEVDSSKLKQANLELKAMPQAASAAERAAQRWGTAMKSAGQSSEQLTNRVKRTVEALEFQRAQLTRNAAEQERYIALRRAGVTAESAGGRAISASIAALQAQRAAMNNVSLAAAAKNRAIGLMHSGLGQLGAVLGVVTLATKAWQTVMEIGSLEEQAEQLGTTTDILQSYRAVAAQVGVSNEQLDAAFLKLGNAMATANEGNDEMIARFEKLGVKLLDAKGQLREPTDVLPELARGLLDVSNKGEQTNQMMAILGRAGPRLRTMLEEWAKGNEKVVESAKGMGAVASAETIRAWDTLGDRIATAGQKWAVFIADLGKDVAIPVLNLLLGQLNLILSLLQKIHGLGAAVVSAYQGQAQQLSSSAGLQQKLKDIDDRIAAHPGAKISSGVVRQREELQRQIAEAQAKEAASARGAASGLQGFVPAPIVSGPGVSQPTGDKAKKAGDSAAEAYRKVIEGAREHIKTKDAETAAIGRNAFEAARLRHEQDLLNKAQNDNRQISAAQRVELAGLAQQMADADVRLAQATFMEDAKKKSEEFIQQKQIEIETIGMSTAQATAYRHEQETLNAATAAGITLKQQDIDLIRQQGEAMGRIAQQAQERVEWYNFEKETFKSLFSETLQGLREGKDLWTSFGDAALGALNKIADKLLDMALTQIFEAAFPKGSGGVGGGIVNIITSILGAASARGNVFRGGNVIPFATGGIVTSPTLFPMSGGRMGLMGEAGAEAVIPLRRGRGGRLGVEGSAISITVAADSEWVRATARDESGRVVAAAAPTIETNAVTKARKVIIPTINADRAERGGDYRAG